MIITKPEGDDEVHEVVRRGVVVRRGEKDVFCLKKNA